MEKSRAIELLEHLACDRDIERNPYGDALNMAIEALKAQLSQEGTTKGKISDTISRQAAIDALDCINGTEEVLRSLPSAQPEYEELTPEKAASEIASGSIMSVWSWFNVIIQLKQMGYAICRKR